VLDLLGEGEALSVDELNGLHRRKTGALLAAALRMGALAAGAPPRAVEAMDRYGQAVGLAFQIVDDVLDATSSAEELGKRPSDEELDKSTYVSHFGAEDARRRASLLVEEAKEALTAAGLSAPELGALADYIVERRR
jgi:geranylgeranyl pyrophosphate synthase